MMIRFVYYLIAAYALINAVSISAQTTQINTELSKQATYETLLTRLKRGDIKVDFGALRIAQSETPNATPYGTSFEIRRQMNVAVLQQRCDDAMKAADEILATNYLSADAHIAKSTCYREAGDAAKAAFHKFVYLGLINSILASGDGAKPESSYTVISIEEEYAVMRALGFTVWKQEQFRRGEHAYELLSGTNDKLNRSAAVYFNIDIPAAIERRKSQK